MRYAPLALLALLCSPALLRAAETNWIFRPGLYSHDPYSGHRVAQFSQRAPVEALPDPRPYRSGYHRSRDVQRTRGGVSEYIRVENYSDGRGGIDAEWERYNNVWQRSVISGSYGYGGFGSGGNGYGNPGYGQPSYGQGGGYYQGNYGQQR